MAKQKHPRIRIATVIPFVVFLGRAALAAAEPEDAGLTPLPRAHAHNDYHHTRPFMDALDHGFCSVEADIFLVNGKLLVGHEPNELRADRTFVSLYLDPLRDIVSRNRGRVYASGDQFTLLVDIKSDGAATYKALNEVLARYPDILTQVENGQLTQRAVTVIVSGNRAAEDIQAASPRYAAIDGRLTDLDRDLPTHLMPLISDDWRKHFQWRGEGPMPPAERSRLREIVGMAHRGKRRIRFWATPENENVWRELLDADVDLINTDDLARLRRFLQRPRKKLLETISH